MQILIVVSLSVLLFMNLSVFYRINTQLFWGSRSQPGEMFSVFKRYLNSHQEVGYYIYSPLSKFEVDTAGMYMAQRAQFELLPTFLDFYSFHNDLYFCQYPKNLTDSPCKKFGFKEVDAIESESYRVVLYKKESQ